MPPEVIQVLYQFPLLLAFIWYTERKDKQFQEFLREERAERGKQLKELSDDFRKAILDLKSIEPKDERRGRL